MSVCSFNLYTTAKLPPVGKYFTCFQIYGESAQAAKCVKSRIITKVIDCVLSINTFRKKCFVIKGMLKSLRLKYHMKTIGIDQSLRNSAIFKHRCLQNIKKLYEHAGKCDNQQQFRDIVEAAMVSTNKGFTNNSPRSPMTPTLYKKPAARKSLRLFTSILDVKK